MAASSKKTFTPQLVERLRVPAKGARVEIMDAVCPGLVLRITDNNVRSFGVLYRVAGRGGIGAQGRPRFGKQQRITLGKYPNVGIKEARDKAREILEAASEGRDPAEEEARRQALRNSTRFEDVVQVFIETDCQPYIKSWRKVESALTLHVVPVFRGMPLEDITRRHVTTLLEDMVAAGKRGMAREVRKHLSKFYTYALERELVSVNPVQGVLRKKLVPNPEAGRSLSDEELRAIWRAAGSIGYPFGPYYRLILLTGQRRAEWSEARWSQIDQTNRWLEVPKEKHKSGRDHIVPLSEPAWQVLQAIEPWGGSDPFIFSTKRGLSPISGYTQGKRRLDAAAREELRIIKNDPKLALPHYRVHDFRVTCETRLAHLGFSQEIRDAVLGHAKPGLQRTYNKHDYMAEKRRALDAYAQHIMEVVG